MISNTYYLRSMGCRHCFATYRSRSLTSYGMAIDEMKIIYEKHVWCKIKTINIHDDIWFEFQEVHMRWSSPMPYWFLWIYVPKSWSFQQCKMDQHYIQRICRGKGPPKGPRVQHEVCHSPPIVMLFVTQRIYITIMHLCICIRACIHRGSYKPKATTLACILVRMVVLRLIFPYSLLNHISSPNNQHK